MNNATNLSFAARDVDRTREFEIRWQATQFVKSFRALAGPKADPMRLREAAVVFASSAEIPGDEARQFIDAVSIMRWGDTP